MNDTAIPAPGPEAVPYARMNGIGNAILVLDLRGSAASFGGREASHIGKHPRFAFDQIMALRPPRAAGTDAFVEIFNIDGSRAGACGNGTRCVAWFLLEGADRDTTKVETDAGLLACRRLAPLRFSVDMGPPAFDWRAIPLSHPVDDTGAAAIEPMPSGGEPLGPATLVSMGNPHAVFFPAPQPPTTDLARLGPLLEHHPLFPERANISFARVSGPDAIELRVWERGAGLTLACGSAACATAVAAVRRGLTGRHVAIGLPGGQLEVEWRAGDDHVIMTGPVELEHRGTLSLPRDAVPA